MKHLNICICALIVSVLALTASSCRTNNGDIGYLYGEWVMTGMVYPDGTETPTPNNYLRFQNDIVQITVIGDHHDSLATFGRWTRSGDTLTLDFSGNLDAEGNLSPNTPLGYLALADQMVLTCEVLTETRRSLVLRVASPRGPFTYLYTKVN